MTVQQLIDALQKVSYPEQREVVIQHQGIRATVGGIGGRSASVVGASQGFDWDTGFVFLKTSPTLTLKTK